MVSIWGRKCCKIDEVSMRYDYIFKKPPHIDRVYTTHFDYIQSKMPAKERRETIIQLPLQLPPMLRAHRATNKVATGEIVTKSSFKAQMQRFGSRLDLNAGSFLPRCLACPRSRYCFLIRMKDRLVGQRKAGLGAEGMV